MPKILIADDNNNIQKMVALAFEERGIQVAAVGNGEAAVRRLADLNPDVVLADIFMPVRSGYEVCEYIKKDQRFSHIPVILLIGAFDPLDEKEARRVGADGVLKKPFVPPDPLIAMVTSVLERNPRIAAELAKAKEAAAEPPPLPEPVIAAKIEPKPLPDFPEPTPEEAALVYGFGSGRRSILEEEKDREEAAEPLDAETEEKYDSDQTTPRWRRAAMDFEVPQQEGGRPAFSDETSFPSQRDATPRPISVPDLEERDEGLEESAETAPVENRETVAADSAFAFAPDPVAGATGAPEAISEPVASEPPAPPFAIAEESPAVAAREPESPATQSAILPEPVFTESGFASNVPHWMDALSAEPSAGEWMAGLTHNQKVPEELQEVAGPLAQPSNERDSFLAEPANDSWFAPAPAPFEAPGKDRNDKNDRSGNNDHEDHNDRNDYDLVESAAVRVTPEPLLQIEGTDLPASVSQRDPELVEQAAVRVIPEPLLDTEERHPAPEPVAAETDWNDDPVVSSVESFAEEFSERIPTGPPPNREALADIPFLTPPPDFHAHLHEDGELSAEAMDAVVQRVVDRLAPQLQELLSQGVLKPLIENLLQGELAKKNR